MPTSTHSSSSNQRFAWLTPLQAQKTSSGPWILCKNHTHLLTICEPATVNVTIDALLRLMAATFIDQTCNTVGLNEIPDNYQSDCKRFEIRRRMPDEDNTSLFIQQPNDYFQRLELFIDDRLVVAYHEPVWPHLQNPNTVAYKHMTLPVHCMEFLEQVAARMSQPQSEAQDSANQNNHYQDQDIAAA